MSTSENELRRQKYAFQHLDFDIPDRSWRERGEWLIGLIDSVAELCELDLLSLAEVDKFQKQALAEVEILGEEAWAHGGDRPLVRALAILDEARCLRGADPNRSAAPARVTLDQWLRWRRHIDHARWLCEQSALSWRADDMISQNKRVGDCIKTMEGLVPILRSSRLEDGPAQARAAVKTALLNAQLIGEANEAKMATEFAAAIVHSAKRWAAFIEALTATKWKEAADPRAYLNAVTGRIYVDIQPDIEKGRDSQGFKHSAGPGGKIKKSDILHGFNATKQDDVPPKPEELTFDHKPLGRADCISLEEIVTEEQEPAKALQERRYTAKSVEELKAAAQEDTDLDAYVNAFTRNPKWKRSDLWASLGWDSTRGRRVDRRYRRLCQRLKDQGAGMEWRTTPTPGGSPSQTVVFETLYDGAKGSENGVWQHKSLEPDEN